ncbi:hypothetical protein BRD14_06855, partial [Halobacteriales archaeon SW_5_68_122]
MTVDIADEQDEWQAALDTAQAELADLVDVRTFRHAGSPGQEVVNFVREHDIDEIIMGLARSGDISTIGSTTRVVLDFVDKPVFVLPSEPPWPSLRGAPGRRAGRPRPRRTPRRGRRPGAGAAAAGGRPTASH